MSPRSRGRLVALAVLAPLTLAGLLLAPASPRPPDRAAAASTVTVGVIGDFGMANDAERRVAALVDSWGADGGGPDAVLGLGDAYYANAGGSGLGKYDLSIGRDWCRYLAGAYRGANCPSGGTAATNRFWTATGNHDYSDAGIGTFTGYVAYPGNERWFAVGIGPLDVFVVDSSAALWDTEEMAAQKAWLESAARASSAPWQVVILHHPPYSSSSAHGSSSAMRWPYAAWGVDLVLAGHDHTYERLERDGIVYVVNGLGGGALYGTGTPIEGSVVRYAANHGALRLVASDGAIEGTFQSVDGVTRDTFRLGRTAPAPSPSPTASPTPRPTPSPAPTTSAARPGAFLKLLPKPGSLVAPGAVVLSWRASPRAIRYQVCVSTRLGRCTTTWRSTTVTRLRVTLPRGATRYWQVRALGPTGLATYANTGRWWRLSAR